MMRSMFAGVSALRNHQVWMDVIGNNIGNVNTSGFKAGRVNFQDLLSQSLRPSAAPQDQRGGVNPVQVGLGLQVSSIDTFHTQGSLQTTGNSTDLAIEGNGFFVANDGLEQFYTRAGLFDVDRDGSLVGRGNGLKLQGWMADNGQIDTTSQVTDLQIPVAKTLDPIATTEVSFGMNVDSRREEGLSYEDFTVDVAGTDYDLSVSVEFAGFFDDPGDPEHGNQIWNWTLDPGGLNPTDPDHVSGTMRLSANGQVSGFVDANGADLVAGIQLEDNATPANTVTITPPAVDPDEPAGGRFVVDGDTVSEATYSRQSVFEVVYDSIGNTHQVFASFIKTGTNDWVWMATDADGENLGSGQLNFEDNGRLPDGQFQGDPIVIELDEAEDLEITPHFELVTQYAEADTLTFLSQNGFPSGQLTTYDIDRDGLITGVFSNGLSEPLAQIGIASFSNPGGLSRAGETMFQRTTNSGSALIGTPGSGGRGTLSPGSLEMSNVDLSQEFTNMIISQRGFQANSRIITTSDEMLQELVNLKR